MEEAFSVLLNKKFTSVDYRLNYQSYKNLLLKCDECHQAVFFKKASGFNNSRINKKVAHFSHYKDIGNIHCNQRTQSNSDTRGTDSEARKQSLENYEKKNSRHH
jgi:hypothetical protein